MTPQLKRPSSPYLDSILGEQFPVLDHGFIRVVDYMGNESSIVQGARTSYGEGTKTVREDTGLLRYLMRHWHTSPYELAVLKLHVKLPIVVERQWVRHRTCSMNELSARYSELPKEFYVASPERLTTQHATNKQGSSDEQVDNAESLHSGFREEAARRFDAYQYRLDAGVARETARNNLPLSTYTEKYWQMNLHNLMHFLRLRMDPHAQWEIRQYANVIGDPILRGWMPAVWDAFTNFRLGSTTFSSDELDILGHLLRQDYEKASALARDLGWLDTTKGGTLKRRSERVEFEKKLERLGTERGADWDWVLN